jgi:hypothetical protein
VPEAEPLDDIRSPPPDLAIEIILIVTDFGKELISKHLWFECFLTSHFWSRRYFIYGF